MRCWVLSSAARASRVLQLGGLHVHEGGDELQAVGDAVIHLAQHGRQTLVGLAQLEFGDLLLAPQVHRLERADESAVEQVEEGLARRLDHIVGRAGLQGGHGHPALFGARDVDDGRRRVQLLEGLERGQAILAGHVVVDRDEIEALGRRLIDALRAASGQLDAVPPSFQLSPGELA